MKTLSSTELMGIPLSTDERAHLQVHTYDMKITLKNKRLISRRVESPRRIDAFIDLAVEAEEEGWDEEIFRVEITEVEFS